MRLIENFKKWLFWNVLPPDDKVFSMCITHLECLPEKCINPAKNTVHPTKKYKKSPHNKALEREKVLLSIKDDLRLLKQEIGKRDNQLNLKYDTLNGALIRRERYGVHPGKLGRNVKAFIKEKCSYEKDCVVTLLNLYSAYVSWAEAKKVKIVSRRGFARFLDPKKITAIRLCTNGKEHRCYKGIKIKI